MSNESVFIQSSFGGCGGDVEKGRMGRSETRRGKSLLFWHMRMLLSENEERMAHMLGKLEEYIDKKRLEVKNVGKKNVWEKRKL